MQSIPVFDREGNPTGEYRFDSNGALKGLELVGKHLAMWTERYEFTDPIMEVLARKIAGMKPEDLRAFIQEQKRKKALEDGNRIVQ